MTPSSTDRGIAASIAGAVVLAAESAGAASLSSDPADLIAGSEGTRSLAASLLEAIAATPAAIAGALAWTGGPLDWLLIVVFAAVLVGLSWLALRLVRRFLAEPLASLGVRPVVVSVLSGAAFIVAGTVLHLLAPGSDRVRGVAFAIYLATTLVLFLSWLARASVERNAGRLDDRLLVIVRVALGLSAFGYILLGLMRLSGAADATQVVVGIVLWLPVVGLALGAVARFLRSRARPRTQSLRDGLEDPVMYTLSRRAGWFFGLTTLLIAAATAISLLRHEATAFGHGVLSLILLGALPILIGLLPDAAAGHTSPWRITIIKSIRLAAFICFWLLLAVLLQVDLVTLTADRFGERAARVLIDVGIAVALGFLFWQVASTFLETLVAAPPPNADGTPSMETQWVARMQTFVPLLRALVLAFIVVATGLIVLAAMGVDIGPLLAGAGIFGIAIGFGSQALVKDVISGLFFLSDDAFRIGEYIEAGSAKGTVESISIRSMKLRHSRGAVYTVPFGSIGVVNNQSRDWAVTKLEFLVDFDTDLMKAKRIVRQIAAELAEDPDVARVMLQAPKFQGVRRLEPSGLVLGIKFTTKPGEQFLVQRETYARIRDAFAEAGIRFAKPQVLVGSNGPGEVPPEAQKAAAMVASQASAKTES